MKKAVIATGSKQYVVSVGDVIEVELVKDAKDSVKFQPLMVIDDKDVSVGAPFVDKAVVEAKVLEQEVKTDKVTAIRYKAKKRVKKIHGHRQRLTRLEITKI